MKYETFGIPLSLIPEKKKIENNKFYHAKNFKNFIETIRYTIRLGLGGVMIIIDVSEVYKVRLG